MALEGPKCHSDLTTPQTEVQGDVGVEGRKGPTWKERCDQEGRTGCRMKNEVQTTSSVPPLVSSLERYQDEVGVRIRPGFTQTQSY